MAKPGYDSQAPWVPQWVARERVLIVVDKRSVRAQQRWAEEQERVLEVVNDNEGAWELSKDELKVLMAGGRVLMVVDDHDVGQSIGNNEDASVLWA